MEFYENEVRPERAFLVSVDTGEFDAEASMSELYELTESAGAQPVGAMIQKREKPDGATCIGSGRLEELKEVCQSQEIDLIIFDCELSPTQIRNLEFETEVRIIDRTMLILDIFASRARSREGKLQVELAQLKYLLPRLTGKGAAMSRLGGGIGTRGPGESKLETDRRHIRRRLESLREQLAQVEQHRNQLRRRREKEGIITAAIVGYTNAGKSTLMNTLTDAGVLAEDKLFATPDPTSRALKLPNGVSVMLIDTVGLVRRLPHHLVEAFHSTLEEAALADMILNVCDASSPEAQVHLEVTRKLLADLGCTGRPVIPVMNKCDLVPSLLDIPMIGNAVRISAKTGEGIGDLLAAVEENLPVSLRRVCLLLPFDQAGLVAQIRKDHVLYQEEYRPDGIFVSALLDPVLYGRVREYEILENT
ncbi:MAG: GTPase HflX [[Clostridium] leptum]